MPGKMPWPACPTPARPATPLSPCFPPQIEILRRLLAAGAQPLPRLLPALLRRYEGLSLSGGLAGKLRQGMQEVLERAVPAPLKRSTSSGSGDGASGSSSSEVSTLVFDEVTGDAWLVAPSPPLAEAPLIALGPQQLHQLLHAAVACRDGARCRRLLLALTPFPAGSRWPDAEANCALLVAAASHGMAAVLQRLLEQPPAVEGGVPPFNPNMVCLLCGLACMHAEPQHATCCWPPGVPPRCQPDCQQKPLPCHGPALRSGAPTA